MFRAVVREALSIQRRQPFLSPSGRTCHSLHINECASFMHVLRVPRCPNALTSPDSAIMHAVDEQIHVCIMRRESPRLLSLHVSSICHVSHHKERIAMWQSRGHCLLNAPTHGDYPVIADTRYMTHQRRHATRRHNVQRQVATSHDQERFNHRDQGRVQRPSESIRLCGRLDEPFLLQHDAVLEPAHGLGSQLACLAVSAACR